MENLQHVANGFQALAENQENERVFQQIREAQFFKSVFINNVPFSKRLNQFIRDWYNTYRHSINFQLDDTDDFDGTDLEGTFQKHLKRFNEENTIQIWKGGSSITIFADAELNHMFRCWHDYTHMVNQLRYDLAGESEVASIQASQLPMDWGYERALINSEIVGQALYFTRYGEFIDDQRAFTVQYLTTGKCTNEFLK